MEFYEENKYGFTNDGNHSAEPERIERDRAYEFTANAEPVQAAPVREETRRSPSRMGRRIIALALCCALIGGLFGVGGTLLTQKLTPSAEPAAEQTSATALKSSSGDSTKVVTMQNDTSTLKSAADVYEQNVNSTVGITTEISTNYWGYQTTAAASGSGFIISEDGYILTNHHVVEDATSVTVAMYDGKEYPAEIVGYDENNDIAVLKIEATGLTPVTVGDSDELRVGDDVVAIGNPLGELTFSLTKGVVSALSREVTMENGVSMKLIQTDCAINSGNSGGALFNLYGEVVGITNAKYSSSGTTQASIDNIGFAIPMNRVKSIVSSIIEKGYFSKPYVGVSITDVSEETQSYGLPKGAAIKEVVKDSPAAQAGLQANDIIVETNGQQITGRTDFADMVSAAQPGDTLKLKVYRQGEYVEVSVTVGEKVQNAKPDAESTEQQSAQPEGRDEQGRNGNGQNPYGEGEKPFGGSENPFGNWGGSGDSEGSGSIEDFFGGSFPFGNWG